MGPESRTRAATASALSYACLERGVKTAGQGPVAEPSIEVYLPDPLWITFSNTISVRDHAEREVCRQTRPYKRPASPAKPRCPLASSYRHQKGPSGRLERRRQVGSSRCREPARSLDRSGNHPQERRRPAQISSKRSRSQARSALTVPFAVERVAHDLGDTTSNFNAPRGKPTGVATLCQRLDIGHRTTRILNP